MTKKIQLNTSIPGPKSQELRIQEDELISPGLQGFALMAGIVVEKAQGSTITDVDGNRFIDIIGGIGVNGLGHSHPRVVKAIQEQVEKVSVGSFSSRSRLRLLQNIKKHAPHPEVYRVQLYSGGSEAVESAMRLAKDATGKFEFVSFWGGFHGKTMGTLSLMGSDFKKGYGPFVPGSHISPYANCYRCPFQLKKESCGMACVEHLRKKIKTETSQEIAAILVEPMQGTAGNVIPPDDFLPAVRSVADEFNALLICDEMITGFGRTGKWWGIHHSGVRPDIVTLGKQFGGGYPVSALLTTTALSQTKPWGNPSGSSSSYGGNPLAAASANAAIESIEEEHLVENSQKMGEVFMNELKPLEDEYSFIGEVRGRGLFIGIEMVKSKETKEALSKKACEIIFKKCLSKGLLTMSYAASFRIQPSMTIDEETAKEACGVLKEVFEEVKKEKLFELN